MRSLLRTLRFRSSARFSAISSQPPLVQLVLQEIADKRLLSFLVLSVSSIAPVTVLPSSFSIAQTEQNNSVHISLSIPGRDLAYSELTGRVFMSWSS